MWTPRRRCALWPLNVPVALVGLIAVVALVPESRSAHHPSIDFGGVILSSTGLVAVMYGVVQAGINGWGSLNAILPAVAGLVALASFVLWERRLAEQPAGSPVACSGGCNSGTVTDRRKRLRRGSGRDFLCLRAARCVCRG